MRDYSPSTGSWASGDPSLFGEGSVNLYSYIDGNPVTQIDPTGTAGCFVDFPDYPIQIPYTEWKTTLTPGHAGFLGYDEATGVTRYYEYGRYKSDFGEVRRTSMPNLKIGKDGQPTESSWNNLKDALSKRAGKGTPVEVSCDSGVDESKSYAYAEKTRNDPKRPPYSWNPFAMNTCRTFVERAMQAGRE